uniref:Uncharacterized protein n=1 Tax=Panagrolaimus davidi TaxID=227884 RepID=A0A914QFF6_9BILA
MPMKSYDTIGIDVVKANTTSIPIFHNALMNSAIVKLKELTSNNIPAVKESKVIPIQNVEHQVSLTSHNSDDDVESSLSDDIEEGSGNEVALNLNKNFSVDDELSNPN